MYFLVVLIYPELLKTTLPSQDHFLGILRCSLFSYRYLVECALTYRDTSQASRPPWVQFGTWVYSQTNPAIGREFRGSKPNTSP